MYKYIFIKFRGQGKHTNVRCTTGFRIPFTSELVVLGSDNTHKPL